MQTRLPPANNSAAPVKDVSAENVQPEASRLLGQFQGLQQAPLLSSHPQMSHNPQQGSEFRV